MISDILSFYRRVAQPEERYPDTVEVVSSSLTAPTIAAVNNLKSMTKYDQLKSSLEKGCFLVYWVYGIYDVLMHFIGHMLILPP